MPLTAHTVTATPSVIVDNSGSSTDLLVGLQYRSDEPGAVCRVATGSSAPAADVAAHVAVWSYAERLVDVRVAGGESMYAWGFNGGVVVDNHF